MQQERSGRSGCNSYKSHCEYINKIANSKYNMPYFYMAVIAFPKSMQFLQEAKRLGPSVNISNIKLILSYLPQALHLRIHECDLGVR